MHIFVIAIHREVSVPIVFLPPRLSHAVIMPPAKSNKGSSVSNDEVDIESLINKVCTTFVKQLECKMDENLEKLDKKLVEVSNSIKLLNVTATSNCKAIEDLSVANDNLEQYSKKNSLRFLGVAESENEVVVKGILHLINNTLKVPCNYQDIDCAFRMGKHINGDKPRVILVNFVSNIKRAEVFYAKKSLKKTKVSVHEDLTHRRYELLMAAKNKYGVGKVWSANGKIFLLKGDDNRKIVINSLNDL